MQDVDGFGVSGPGVGLSGSGVVLAELGDGELLGLARSGGREAFAVLFRRYSFAAHRLARHLGQREEAEDVVAESFAQVWDLLCRGKGPQTAFRAYVFTTIRHEAGRRAKARQKVMPTDDVDQVDQVVPFGAGQLEGFERSVIRAAYESLPPRWRQVLWHVDVEGRKPQELGPVLGLSANGVSALVYRARAGLREAYLQQHVNSDAPVGRGCVQVRGKLSGFVRRTVSMREQERIHAHLQSCADCMAVHLDLKETNTQVGHIVFPAALAVSLVGGAAAMSASAGLSALIGNIALAVKGAVLALAPPVAAATMTTATLVTFSSATGTVTDPPRHPMSSAVRTSAPAQQPAITRVTTPPAAASPGSSQREPAAARPATGSPDRVPSVPPPAPSAHKDHAAASSTVIEPLEQLVGGVVDGVVGGVVDDVAATLRAVAG